jgi:HK97 family phage portal protein
LPEFGVFKNPNPWLTRFDFWEATTLYLELTGKAFWELVKDDDGNIVEMYPLIPSYMKPVKHKKKFIIGWIYEPPNTKPIKYRIEDIVFLRYYDPNNPYDGLGSLEASANAAASDIYSQQYGLSFFKNSGRPDGLITHESELSDADYDRVRTNWDKAHQGISQAHRIAIIEQGMKYEQISSTQKDMQFIQQRKYSRDEILATFGVPPATVGVFESAIKANAEVQERIFWTETMTPKLLKMAEMIQRTIIPIIINSSNLDLDIKRIETDFDTSKVYILSQIWRDREQFLDDHVTNGLMGKDEARTILNKIYGEITSINPLKEGGRDIIINNNTANKVGEVEETKAEQSLKKSDDKYNVLQKQFEEFVGANVVFDMNDPEIIDILNTKPMLIKASMQSNEIARAVMIAGIEQGLDIKDIQDNIFDRFKSSGEFSIARTTRIAQTENIQAANGSTLKAYKQSGVVEKKIWLTSRDSKVRPATKWDKGNHIRLDGEEQNLDDLFSNGLMYPGDQRGAPEESVNCRCTLLSRTIAAGGQAATIATSSDDNIVQKIQLGRFEKQINRQEKQIQDLFLQFFELAGNEYIKRLNTIPLSKAAIGSFMIDPENFADKMNEDYKPLKTAIVRSYGQIELDKLRI